MRNNTPAQRALLNRPSSHPHKGNQIYKEGRSPWRKANGSHLPQTRPQRCNWNKHRWPFSLVYNHPILASLSLPRNNSLESCTDS